MESESFYGECTGPVLVGGRCNGDPRWILHGCSSGRHKNESAIQPSCTSPFPGVTLSEKEPIAQFDVPDIPEEYIVHSHKLIIKQISLGPEAKSGEFNVVQVSPAKGDYLEPPAVVNHRTAFSIIPLYVHLFLNYNGR